MSHPPAPPNPPFLPSSLFIEAAAPFDLYACGMRVSWRPVVAKAAGEKEERWRGDGGGGFSKWVKAGREGEERDRERERGGFGVMEGGGGREQGGESGGEGVAFFLPAQKLSGGTMSMENGVCPGRH